MNSEQANPEYPIIRCRAHDICWLLGFIAGQNTYENMQRELPERLQAVDGMELLSEIIRLSQELYNRLICTYPESKQQSIENQRERLYYHIDVGRSPLPDKTRTIVDVDVLNVIVQHAHECCILCDHPQRCNSCDLGKALDRCVPDDRARGQSWATIDVAANG